MKCCMGGELDEMIYKLSSNAKSKHSLIFVSSLSKESCTRKNYGEGNGGKNIEYSFYCIVKNV